ncbi:MAG TPA: hypothetical protein VFX37_05140 [Pseudolabrys sp.]|nr:hypothetical protein [Pseudolabrys sp.]
MFTEQEMSQLTDDIYDAALDPQCWPSVLGRLAQSFDSTSAQLSEDNFTMTQGRLISFGTDPSFEKDYAAYYAARNVLWERTMRRPLDEITTDRIVMPKDELRQSEFYNDFLHPHDCDELLISVVWPQADKANIVTLGRPERLGAWQPAEMKAFTALKPHLQRALQINEHVRGLSVLHECAAEALGRLDQGVIVAGAEAQVLFANETAETLLSKADCLFLESRRLAAGRPSDTMSLQQLIADAARKRIGGSLVIGREGRPAMVVTVAPVKAERGHRISVQPSAIVVIRDLERPTKPCLAVFARHFGLTPAQTALAAEIVKGDGVASAAARVGISYATARTHLVQIFQKTQTRRQAELVRLMSAWNEGSFISPSATTNSQ